MEIIINGIKIDDNTRFEYNQNPKRPNSNAHRRYNLYHVATSLVDYERLTKEDPSMKKYSRADLRYDVEHHHLKLFDGDTLLNPIPTEEKEEMSVAEAKSTKPKSTRTKTTRTRTKTTKAA